MARPRKNTVDNETELGTVEMQESVDTATESAVEPTTSVESAEQEAQSMSKKSSEVNIEALMAHVKELEAQVAASKDSNSPVVQLEYIDCVSDQNELDLGDYGYIRGSTGSIDVPKKEFGGRFMTPLARWLLDTRRLVVLNGLTSNERKRYGVDYKEGEVMDTQAFDRLLDMSQEKLVSIFERLCDDHRWFVARRFITAFEKGDNRVSREKVEVLNNMSKTETFPEGMFAPVLKGMNKI